MGVIGRDARVFFRDFIEGPLPEVVGVGQHVGLGAERHLVLPVARLGRLEGEADAPFDTLPGIDGLLHRDLVGRALLVHAAGADVQVLRVLPDHDEVHVIGTLVLQRAVHARVQLDGTQVDIEVQFEPDRQQDALFQQARRAVRMSDGAEVDGIVVAKFLQALPRQYFSRPQVSFTAEIVFCEFIVE